MTKKIFGRLAFRKENGYWNAYLAPVDTMEGATLLGSIAMALIVDNLELELQFVDLMQKGLEKELSGVLKTAH